MSPRKPPRAPDDPVVLALARLWLEFGREVRDARLARRWSVAELAERARLSMPTVYAVESGMTGSAEAAARLASALGRRAELILIDPRKRDQRPNLSSDPVHSAMGEFEAAHFRHLALSIGIDEPYQHYQFAGRADLVAWDLEARALLHIENRTRFPDMQEMAGAFNSKKAYLGRVLAARLNVRGWSSETHVIAALWSSEVLHALRLRTNSFRAICPDESSAFESWWLGKPPPKGNASTLIVLDPVATTRQRAFIGFDEALSTKPRHRGYAAVVAALEST